MTRTTISVSVDFQMDEDALKEVVLRKLSESGRLEPHSVVVGDDRVDYARHVEFGSGPVRQKSESGRSFFAELRKWVENTVDFNKTGNRERDLDSTTYLIYRKICKEGLPPRPTVRPAMHSLQSRIPPGFLNDGGSVKDLAEILASAIRDNMEAEGFRKGPLYNSVRVVPTSELETEDFSYDIPQNIWDSDVLDLNGQDRSRLRAKRT